MITQKAAATKSFTQVEEKMKVFCRFAPPLTDSRDQMIRVKREKLSVSNAEDSPGICTTPTASTRTDSTVKLTVADPITGGALVVTMDDVFLANGALSENSQRHVFETVAVPVVEAALSGQHCALMAYGQTATGKTHTMFGPDGGNVRYFHSVDARGLVPRIAEYLFATPRHYTPVVGIELSYLELYNETATDLIAKVLTSPNGAETATAQFWMTNSHQPSDAARRGKKSPQDAAVRSLQLTYKPTEKLRLRHSVQRVFCTSSEMLLQVIGELSAMRNVSTTDRNFKSSRSHILLDLYIHVRDQPHPGRLTLVDLAGSESLRPSSVSSSAHHSSSSNSAVSLSSSYSQLYSSFEGAAAQQSAATQSAQRHKEMRHINTSLFALKKLVHAMRGQQGHIPLHDSMLTALVAESLQAQASAMIVCLSSNRVDFQETVSSIRLGAEASLIPCSVRLPIGSVSISPEAAERGRCSLPLEHQNHFLSDVPLPRMEPFSSSSSMGGVSIRSVSQMLAVAGRGGGDAEISESLPVSSVASSRASSVHEGRELNAAGSEREEIATLRLQVKRLAEAYDKVYEELEESKRTISLQNSQIHRLKLEVLLAKNDQSLRPNLASSAESSSSPTLPSRTANEPLIQSSSVPNDDGDDNMEEHRELEMSPPRIAQPCENPVRTGSPPPLPQLGAKKLPFSDVSVNQQRPERATLFKKEEGRATTSTSNLSTESIEMKAMRVYHQMHNDSRHDDGIPPARAWQQVELRQDGEESANDEGLLSLGRAQRRVVQIFTPSSEWRMTSSGGDVNVQDEERYPRLNEATRRRV